MDLKYYILLIIENNPPIIKKALSNSSLDNSLIPSFIGVIGVLIAILFTILITIVANSSFKYPSNFINKLSNDKKTKWFYRLLVLLIIIQIFFFHLEISNYLLDIVLILIIFGVLFWYWRYILNFINPERSIDSMDVSKLKDEELSELGDYAKIGIENNNDVITDKAIDKLLKFDKRLKDE